MLGCLLNRPGGGSSQCGCVLDVWPLELKVSMPRQAVCLGKGLHLTGALQSHPPRVLVQKESGLTGRCSCRGAHGPHLALTFLPAPGNLSGPSLIYQHPPAVLGTSLLRALAVPGGHCPEEPPAPALLAEVRDDSASDSDRGCFFFFFSRTFCTFCVPPSRLKRQGTRATCWLLSFSKAKSTLLKVTFWARFLREAPGPSRPP